MKSKKVVLIALMIGSFVLFSSINVMAAAGWFTCTVLSSTAGGAPQCQLTGTEDSGSRSFTNKTFILNSADANSMLAVLLSAQAVGSQVRVYVDPDAGTFPTIFGVSMLSE